MFDVVTPWYKCKNYKASIGTDDDGDFCESDENVNKRANIQDVEACKVRYCHLSHNVAMSNTYRNRQGELFYPIVHFCNLSKKTLLFIWFQVEYEVLCVQVECEVEQNCRFWSFDKTSSSCFLLVRLSHDLYFVENHLLLITEWWTFLLNFCLIWPMMLKTASCK